MTTTSTVQSVPRPKGGLVWPEEFVKDEKDSSGWPVVSKWHQSYVGAVLMTYERNGYDDSDFFAVVYDEATDSLKHVEYASTRGWSYMNSATVDATEEVKAKAREILRKQSFARLTDEAAREAKTPEKGKTVRVTKGRKVPVGTEGTVVWKGVDGYKSTQHSTHYRLGVKDAEGTVHWTSADNCEVVDPQEYMPAWSDLEQRAARYARGDHWRQY